MTHNWSGLESFVYKCMTEHLIPGAAVAVWQNGSTVYARGFGHRDRGTHEPVDADTVFGIASITKSFTTMAVMQLVDRGLLSVDTPVTEYVPEFHPKAIRPGEVRISHLLSHTAGLPPLPSISYTPSDNERLPPTLTTPEGLITADALGAYLRHINDDTYEVYGRPGEYFSYSNPCFVIASAVIERIVGQPFYQYVRENIFRPIGMGRTTFLTSDLAGMSNVTRLYSNNKKGETLPVLEWPDARVFGASGGIKSTANDLVKYAAVYANGGARGHIRVLSETSVRRMYTPVHKLTRSAHYGFAVQVTPDYWGYTLVEHGGSLTGVSSTFGFVPEASLAAVTLTNVQNAPAADIWLAAINTALGMPIEQKRIVEPFWVAPPRHLEKYVGAYKSAEGADIRINSGNNGITIRMGDDEFPLRATGEEYASYDYYGQERLVRFFLKPDGGVLGMFHGTSMSGIRLVRKVE